MTTEGEIADTVAWLNRGPNASRAAARLIERLAGELAAVKTYLGTSHGELGTEVLRLSGELAKFEGSDAVRECASLRAELDRAKANHLAACGNAQQDYTDLENESKAHLGAAHGEIDALRSQLAARDAEVKLATDALTELSTLGGGRSDDNAIAQHALAKLGKEAT